MQIWIDEAGLSFKITFNLLKLSFQDFQKFWFESLSKSKTSRFDPSKVRDTKGVAAEWMKVFFTCSALVENLRGTGRIGGETSWDKTSELTMGLLENFKNEVIFWTKKYQMQYITNWINGK